MLPRIFQGDLDRFFQRVVRPALKELCLHEDIKENRLLSFDEYFERAAQVTFNLLVYDARQCYALALAAIFERHLRIWAYKSFPDKEKSKIFDWTYCNLWKRIIEDHQITYDRCHDTIKELHLLANAVRHGDGRSVDKLQKQSPHLWPPVTEFAALNPKERSSLSGNIRVSDEIFIRYIRALIRFWGLADKEPNAITVGPY